MSKENRTRKEILEENKKLLVEIYNEGLDYVRYPKDKEEIKRILGTIFDDSKKLDLDPSQGESYENMEAILGKEENVPERKQRASVLLVNFRYKRCLRECKKFKELKKERGPRRLLTNIF